MIQVIAVHSVGTMPRAMELKTTGLNPVQLHALQHLPRSPAGVPELRPLGKTDGPLRFKFQVPPEKLTQEHLPELLSLWDLKFTEAKLKLLAKDHKAERDAANAAGLWKEGNEKGDLTTLHAQATPEETVKFSQALATCAIAKKAPAKPKRIPKPKLVDSVIAATTEVDLATGERKDKISTVDGAVATLRARELVKGMRATSEQIEHDDPLELARLEELAKTTPVEETRDALYIEQSAAQPVQATFPPVEQPDTLNAATTEIEQAQGRGLAEPPAASPIELAHQAIERHKTGKAPGPKLIEMDPQDLFARLDQERAKPVESGAKARVNVWPGMGTALPQTHVTHDAMELHAGTGLAAVLAPTATGEQAEPEGFALDQHDPGFDPQNDSAPPDFSMYEQDGQGAQFYDEDHASRDWAEDEAPVTAAWDEDQVAVQALPTLDATHTDAEPAPAPLDWRELSTYRLSSQANSGLAVVLPTGEVFEGLAQITMTEPLTVQVDWLNAAAREAQVELPHQDQLDHITNWMTQQLAWRSKELMRWLGKGDLVTPESQADLHNGKKEKNRPHGWVNTGMEMAGLAQQISMDIAMLNLCGSEINRSLAGMPAWAIDAMQQMCAFETLQAENPINEQTMQPSAAFRDSWREELLRIDRWCAMFKTIRMARQIGLFGSTADQKLLTRLEAMIERTKTWQAAPAQASRVLAVWIAFVLSLDHISIAAAYLRPALQATESKTKNARGRHRAAPERQLSFTTKACHA